MPRCARPFELDKNNSDALLKLGQVQVAEGSVSQALATYQQSIKDHPREIEFYILSGEMYESQGNQDQAKAMYQKALEFQPDNPLASNNLAYLILQQLHQGGSGNVDVALAMAQTARRGWPDSPHAADTLGFAYLQKGVYQSAIDMFQESLRLSENQGTADSPTVHYHLALAYQKNQPAGSGAPATGAHLKDRSELRRCAQGVVGSARIKLAFAGRRTSPIHRADHDDLSPLCIWEQSAPRSRAL